MTCCNSPMRHLDFRGHATVPPFAPASATTLPIPKASARDVSPCILPKGWRCDKCGETRA